MNEFEEITWTRNIQQLLLDRLIECTAAEVRRRALKYAQQLRCTLKEAYEQWEAVLLSKNPREGEFDS